MYNILFTESAGILHESRAWGKIILEILKDGTTIINHNRWGSFFNKKEKPKQNYKYDIVDNDIIINGNDYPEEYDKFRVDKWVIKNDSLKVEYDHNKSGYENDQYVVYLNLPFSYPDIRILNHEIKHAYQDWNRISRGYPPLKQTKELTQIYTKDFERYILSHPVGSNLGSIEGLIKGYYLTSNPEITAYLEGEYDKIEGLTPIHNYEHYAKLLTNLKVEDIEKNTKPINLQKKWNKIRNNYDIPFFKKFKDVNDFIKYSVKFLNRRGSKIQNKINKLKYLHQQK